MKAAEQPAGAAPLPVLCFVVVHYDNTEEVCRFVEHVLALPVPPGWRVDLVLTDNSRSLDPRPLERANVCVLRPASNLGYLGAAAGAIEQWRRRHGGLPAWVALTNTDLHFDASFLERLLTYPWPADTGVVAPEIRHVGTGRAQNPFLWKRPPRLQMWLYRVAFRSIVPASVLYSLAAWKAKRLVCGPSGPASVRTEPVEVYAAHGSAILLRSTFFARGGTLRYRGFLFGEEIHLAEQSRRAGLAVRWWPALTVWHEGRSTTARLALRQQRQWQAESARVLWEDYFASRR